VDVAVKVTFNVGAPEVADALGAGGVVGGGFEAKTGAAIIASVTIKETKPFFILFLPFQTL
jgi:hypothetical protein